MSKVVSINRNRFLGAYTSAQNTQRIPDNPIFFAGVFLTIVIPVITYCSSGGPISAILFAFVALAGTVVGLVKYNQPRRKASIAGSRANPRARPTRSSERKQGGRFTN